LVRIIYRWLGGWQELTVSLLRQELARVTLMHLCTWRDCSGVEVLTTLRPRCFSGCSDPGLVRGILLTVMTPLPGWFITVAAAAQGLDRRGTITGERVAR
jgi:hypothetical protein